jgi:hypothetical protein
VHKLVLALSILRAVFVSILLNPGDLFHGVFRWYEVVLSGGIEDIEDPFDP